MCNKYKLNCLILYIIQIRFGKIKNQITFIRNSPIIIGITLNAYVP